MIAFLEASLVRPLGLVAVAWIVLRVLRIQHPASRHAVWTAVLIGMLLLPIVSVVGPRWTLAVLPAADVAESQPTPTRGSSPPEVRPTSAVAPADVPAEPASSIATAPGLSTNAPAPFEWPSPEALIAGGYLAGLCAMAGCTDWLAGCCSVVCCRDREGCGPRLCANRPTWSRPSPWASCDRS